MATGNDGSKLTFDVNCSSSGHGNSSGVFSFTVKLQAVIHTWGGGGQGCRVGGGAETQTETQEERESFKSHFLYLESNYHFWWHAALLILLMSYSTLIITAQMTTVLRHTSKWRLWNLLNTDTTSPYSSHDALGQLRVLSPWTRRTDGDGLGSPTWAPPNHHSTSTGPGGPTAAQVRLKGTLGRTDTSCGSWMK